MQFKHLILRTKVKEKAPSQMKYLHALLISFDMRLYLYQILNVKNIFSKPRSYKFTYMYDYS